MRWIQKLKNENEDAYALYTESIKPLMTPKRAKGPIFREDHRKKAGVPDSWITSIRNA
jgi:hypothetical protein